MSILLWLLILICIIITGWAFLNWNRPYRFTFFFILSFAGFALPQLIGLSNESGSVFAGTLPEGALDMLIFVAITCVLACFLGDLRASGRPQRAPILGDEDYDVDRLVRVAVFLTVGSIVVHQIGMNMISQEEITAMGGQMTGKITIIIFLSMMQRYGFAISVLLFVRHRKALALLCALFGVFWTTVMFVSSFRRGSSADMVFILILGLYFGRRLILPAWLVGSIMMFGALWSNCIGQFRAYENLNLLEKFKNTDLLQEFNYTLENGGHELTNAAMWVWCADAENEYDFGRIHWNQLVHGYFPGQIFGNELKTQLKFPERNLPLERFNYRGLTGATKTGLSDAFCSFWYLGCIKYYIIGYVMGRWWNRANRGDLRSQLTYMALMGSALHTITHGTFWLMNNYIHMVIFAYPCLWWARRSSPHEVPANFTARPVRRSMLHFQG